MQVRELSMAGVKTPVAWATQAHNGREYYSLVHGQKGRGRWEIRIPLSVRAFPVGERKFPMEGEFDLLPLGKEDAAGNPQLVFVEGSGETEGAQLVLWSLSPGFRGGASFSVGGEAVKVLAQGREAQGIAGGMGGAACPIVLLRGPCVLRWKRTGRLYGSPSEWIAIWDGHSWTVGPAHECAAEQAAFDH